LTGKTVQGGLGVWRFSLIVGAASTWFSHREARPDAFHLHRQLTALGITEFTVFGKPAESLSAAVPIPTVR
jgi:hypothetical protein